MNNLHLTNKPRKTSYDPFAEFYREKEEKYKGILSGDEPHEYSMDIGDLYYRIFDYEITPRELDAYLVRFNGGEYKPLVISDIKAAIADSIGDMIETYRYESTEEGRAIECYIDKLLAVVKKHEIPLAGFKTATAFFSERKAPRRESRKDIGLKPTQDVLFI